MCMIREREIFSTASSTLFESRTEEAVDGAVLSTSCSQFRFVKSWLHTSRSANCGKMRQTEPA